MKPEKRIAVNTLATYSRTLISAAFSLFSSRWALHALGADGYGLYNVVAAIIAFSAFFSGVMITSASRFFSHSIGRHAPEETSNWFNASILLHAFLCLLALAIAYPMGNLLIYHTLKIPPNQLSITLDVYRISLLSALINIMLVPYIAMFTAKQKLATPALLGIAQSALTLALNFSLDAFPSNRLLIYATGIAAISLAYQIAIAIIATSQFPECRLIPSAWRNKQHIIQIIKFGSWNAIGSFGYLSKIQGTSILLNTNFGTHVNAAFGIASQVTSQTNQLSAAMTGAMSPEIIASESRGDRKRMLLLSDKVSLYGTLLISLFAIPLIIDMEYVLQAWLRSPPTYTATFCRSMLITFIIERLGAGSLISITAHGRIALFQSIVGISECLSLPISYALIMTGHSPIVIGYGLVATATISTLGKIIWASHRFSSPLASWVCGVALPSFYSTIPSIGCALLIKISMQPSFARLLAITISSGLCITITSWFTALTQDDRAVLVDKFKQRITKTQP